jgi:DNA polymerase-3 subunit epsilon
MPVLQRPLAFVDLETTGATPTRDRITEVAVVSWDGESVQRWSQLLDPGQPIPAFIARLTGIDDRMVAGQPVFADIAPALWQRLQGHVFVAHNARFDYGFLKNEFRRVGLELRLPVLCTVKLSRRLFPQHRRHNLDSLIDRHGLQVEQRHRALADSEAIYQFWLQVQGSVLPARLEAVLRELLARPSLPPHLDPELVDELPESPGVYLFYGDDDLCLYIGKSRQLRQRVMAHFSADHASAKEMSLSQQVRRIDWIECAGEIDALLTESRLIKERQPSLNRQLRRQKELCAWQLQEAEDGLWRTELVHASDLDFGRQDRLYGLFRNGKEAKTALTDLAQAHGLCLASLGLEKRVAGRPCFARQLQHCQGLCVGAESPLQHNLRLFSALARLKLEAWPYAGPALLAEGPVQHVIDAWCYLGTAHDESELTELLCRARPEFDRDTYRILVKHRQALRPLPCRLDSSTAACDL